jgi:ribosomal protein S18 acetylase RimI-like enzyme
MSTSPVASQLEILDLRHFSARQLRPLLEQEAARWQELLRWDYSSSTELLLQYLESRVLQGYAALSRGQVCGYAFCVYEGNKAVIGDAFSSSVGHIRQLETTRTLLVHVLESLRHSPLVDRIEAQLLLSNAGDFASIFRGPEFRTFPRLFLECDFASGSKSNARLDGSDEELPADIALSQWVPQDYQSAGELIHASYVGHTDSEINDQYRSLHGALRFLHNIVRFPGCGVFEPAYSWVLRDRTSRKPVGLVLASRVGPEVAHITQFCISPKYRERGLGSDLLWHSLQALRSAGFQAITLTVTEANQPAVRLYEHFGFCRRHRFDAVVFESRRRS